MKKILITTTALTLSAGFAAAQNVNITGYGFAGVVNSSTWDTTLASSNRVLIQNTAIQQRIRLEFTGTTTANTGTSFSAYVRMNANNTGAIASDRARITVKHDNLTVAFGNTNGAMRTLARSATYYGFNDGGIFGADNSVSGAQTDGGNNVLVRYDMGAFSGAISTDAALSGTYEIAARYTFQGFTLGAGYSNRGAIAGAAGAALETVTTNAGLFAGSTVARAADAWMVSAGYKMGDVDITLGANSDNRFVGGLGYTMGDWSFGLAAASGALDGGTDIGANIGYNLGGGVTLSLSAGNSVTAPTAAADGFRSTTVGAGLLFKF